MNDTLTVSRTAAELIFRAFSIKQPRLAAKLHPWLRPLSLALAAARQGDPRRSIQVPSPAGDMEAQDILELVSRWVGKDMLDTAVRMVEQEGIRYE
jgi:hypothetical protein